MRTAHFQASGVDRLPQVQQVGARLNDVDENRVERADRGQQAGLAGRDQRTGRQRRAVGPAADRRLDRRVVEIDPGGLDGGFRGGHLRFRLGERGNGIVEILFADGVLFDEALIALRLGLRAGHRSFRLPQSRDGAVIGRLVGRRIDLVERRTFGDFAPLGEQALLNDAGHLGTHLGRLRRDDPTGKLRGYRHRLRAQRHDAELGTVDAGGIGAVIVRVRFATGKRHGERQGRDRGNR